MNVTGFLGSLGRIRWGVFAPVFLLLVSCLTLSQVQEDQFLDLVQTTNRWILLHFDWLFNGATVFFLLCLLLTYVSPLGAQRIGGPSAVRLLKPRKYFAITICTTIAAGILFWACSEPLYHLYEPPSFAGVDPGTPEAEAFAISSLLLHWTLTPYGIYTILAVTFAYCYYNCQTSFSVAAMMQPLFRQEPNQGWATIIDVCCLFALILGMSAALGAGILTMAGGIERVFDIPISNLVTGLIAATVVTTFIISSVSGLHRGIQVFSLLNVRFFILLLLFCFIFSIDWGGWQMGARGLTHYARNFISSSIGHFAEADRSWTADWTVFYWAAWFAWAPCSALFLGRISRGYTVRQVIQFNLLYPSLFIAVWMILFGGGTLALERQAPGQLYELLLAEGPQAIVYRYFDAMPLAELISGLFLLIVFITFVTAADSNTSVMGGISMKDSNMLNPEAPAGLKVLWGSIIGISSWLMISSTGVDGIRILSTIGGFPVLFIAIIIAIGLLKLNYKMLVQKTTQ